MKLDLTHRQADEVYSSIHRTLIDMGAECWEQQVYSKEPLSDYCRDVSRAMDILRRVLNKLEHTRRPAKHQTRNGDPS